MPSASKLDTADLKQRAKPQGSSDAAVPEREDLPHSYLPEDRDCEHEGDNERERQRQRAQQEQEQDKESRIASASNRVRINSPCQPPPSRKPKEVDKRISSI
jgi:hypothetical protein